MPQANVHADGRRNNRALGGNNAAHRRANSPVHVRHGRNPLKNKGKLRHVQELRSRLVFEWHTFGPCLNGRAIFGFQDVVGCFVGHARLPLVTRIYQQNGP
jgi:hypothetical protein